MRRSLTLAFLATLLLAACSDTGNDGGGTWVADMKACEGGHSPAVFAVDVQSGGLRWTFCPDGQSIADVLGATDRLVYATVTKPSGEYALIALDAASGKERWRAETAVSWTPGPFAGGDIVAVPFNLQIVDGRLGDWEIAGLDASTGKVRWQVPANGSIPLAQSDDTVVVAGARSGGAQPVRGLDRSNGKERWNSGIRIDDRSGVGVSRSPLAITGNTIIVPSGAEAVGLSVKNGAELWRSPQLDHPTASEGVAIGSKGQGPSAAAQALDASSGKPLWNAPGRPSYGDIWALGDGAAYVISEGVIAYDLRTGGERWRRDDVPEPWAAGDGTVYVGWERIVGALSAKDGKTRWMLRPALVGESWMTGLVTNSRSAFIAVDNFAPTD